MNNIPAAYPKLTIEELEIIGYFTRGQKYSFSTKNLKLDFSKTSIRLSDSQGKLVGISKQVNEWQRKALVSNNSIYSLKIVEVLSEQGFISKQKSSHPDFTEHHYYKIPNGYKLNYTKILQLWKVWWNNKRYQLHPRNPSVDPLIFTKGNWQRIQDLQPQQDHFLLQIVNGEPIICGEDWVIWIDKLEPKPIALSRQPISETSPIQTSSALADSNQSHPNTNIKIMSPSITPRTPLGSPQKDRTNIVKSLPIQAEEEIDLDYYLSTFNTEDTEDVERIEGIYNIGELLGDTSQGEELTPSAPKSKSKSPLRLDAKVIANPSHIPPIVEPSVSKMQPNLTQNTPPRSPKSPTSFFTSEPSISTPINQPLPTLSIAERKQSSKLKAFDTIAKYLREGDRVTHTETIKNTQGEVINRKTIEIQRGCPSWAIDIVKDLSASRV